MAVSAHHERGAKRRSNGNDLPLKTVRWDKKMSNNSAVALLVYTMLQIFVVLKFIETKGMSIAPYFGLVLLVGVIIPVCRKYEKRWRNVDSFGLTGHSLAARFRKDQIALWTLTLGIPLFFIGVILLIRAIF